VTDIVFAKVPECWRWHAGQRRFCGGAQGKSHPTVDPAGTYNVASWGVVGNASQNDTADIQIAINAAPCNGGARS
jgi:hypothetical protein